MALGHAQALSMLSNAWPWWVSQPQASHCLDPMAAQSLHESQTHRAQCPQCTWLAKAHTPQNTAHGYNRESAEEEMGFIPSCTAGVERLARGLGGRSLENTEQAAALGPAMTSREGRRVGKGGEGRTEGRRERRNNKVSQVSQLQTQRGALQRVGKQGEQTRGAVIPL